jgi:hypothetical protein
MQSPVTNTAATVGVASDNMGDVGDRIGMQTWVGGCTALKRRALDLDTSMGELIRNASSGLRDPTALATASIEHRGGSGGVPATLDLPRGVLRALQRLVAAEETSLQALVVAAILQTYADLAWSWMTHGLIHVYQGGRAFGRPG